MADNNNTTINNNHNVNDDNTVQYQRFVECHPPGTPNPCHFQVLVTVHDFHGPIVLLEHFRLTLGDEVECTIDFFRGPTNRQVDIYWENPLGDFIRYHHNEVLYFDYSSIITLGDGEDPDPHPDRTQYPCNNHSTPSPPPLCVNNIRSRSPFSSLLRTKRNKYTSLSPSPTFHPSKRTTDRRHRRDTHHRYLWKLVAYTGGLKAYLQKQKQQKQDKQEKLKQLRQQTPLAVYTCTDGSSHQQHQSQQQFYTQQLQQQQQRYRSPQQQQQPSNRSPILAHSFTHYGRRFDHRQSYNHYHSQSYNSHSQGHNQRYSQGHSQNQGQFYDQFQCYNSHDQGSNQIQSPNHHNQVQSCNNSHGQVYSYLPSPAMIQLAKDHTESCRLYRINLENYLDRLYFLRGGRPLNLLHPRPPPAADQRQYAPVSGGGREQGQEEPETEQGEDEEDEEPLVRRGPQMLLKRRRPSEDKGASNEGEEEKDEIEVKQEVLSDGEPVAFQRTPQMCSDREESSENEVKVTEDDSNASFVRGPETPPTNNDDAPIAKRTRSRSSLSTIPRAPFAPRAKKSRK